MLYILYMSRLPIWIQCHFLLRQSHIFSVNLLLKMGLINCAFRRVRNPDSRIHLSRSVSRQFTIIILFTTSRVLKVLRIDSIIFRRFDRDYEWHVRFYILVCRERCFKTFHQFHRQAIKPCLFQRHFRQATFWTQNTWLAQNFET